MKWPLWLAWAAGWLCVAGALPCPPFGFDSMEGFELERLVAVTSPWYVQMQVREFFPIAAGSARHVSARRALTVTRLLVVCHTGVGRARR
jgi:hypothetical protein